MSDPEFTGALFTDSTRLVKCPRCGAAPGTQCVMPSGRKLDPPHKNRVGVLIAQFPGALKAATHKYEEPSFLRRKT